MGELRLSKEAAAFLEAHIRTVEELEALLLVRMNRNAEWGAIRVASELHVDPIRAALDLSGLVNCGLLFHIPTRGKLAGYCWANPPVSDAALDELDRACREHRTEVLRRLNRVAAIA